MIFFFFKLWYHAKILRQVNKLLAMQRTIQAIETQARKEKKKKHGNQETTEPTTSVRGKKEQALFLMLI